ncbi:claudin-34-like [Parambassis ranga]|uniref:Claudin-34-like n=1 Tax=Parambassis ranga TaxID=210632 RepID=A0A6P7I5D6_9TELE|nr:claudin-34-like [Parambassis ranga]
MAYLVHTAYAQLAALWLACVGWTLTAVALGLIQWRVWQVSDRRFISSGVAWVGIWRVCFNSHTVVSPGFRGMHCRSISLTEAFTPPEIVAAQVLMFLSVLAGICGNAAGVCAMRSVCFGVAKHARSGFVTSGALCLLAAATSLVPLLWNLRSVVTNQTIGFPPEFKMPPAPDSQHVGSGISVGMVGGVLMVVSGIIFCTYRLPVRPRPGTRPPLREQDLTGEDNPAFECQERL